MPVKAYHFCASDYNGNALLRDGSIVAPGTKEIFSGTLIICKSGLHASRHPFDAFEYAPGPIIRLVLCGGKKYEESDKLVCEKRHEIARFDAAKILRLFACDCAERALKRERDAKRETDVKSWAAIEAARKFADGKITIYELAAARDASWAAARAASWDAARDAARAAAWAASWDAASAAAWAAARDAARAAARAAASAAAWAAEKKRQRSHFEKIIDTEFSKILKKEKNARR
jgi:hypothetical protein